MVSADFERSRSLANDWKNWATLWQAVQIGIERPFTSRIAASRSWLQHGILSLYDEDSLLCICSINKIILNYRSTSVYAKKMASLGLTQAVEQWTDGSISRDASPSAYIASETS